MMSKFKLPADWKSTAIGLLGLAIVVILALIALPPKASALAIALAVARAVLNWLQKEPGTTDALLPGSSVPEKVASHETPDDPAAVAVIEPRQ